MAGVRKSKSSVVSAKWLDVTIKSAAWPVIITNDPTCFFEDNNEGCCDYEKSTIYIASWVPEAQKPNVLIHEIIHAIVYTMGVGQLMALLAEAKEDDREERLVSLLAPDLYDTLSRNGMLVIPKLPKLPKEALEKNSK